MNVSRFQWFKNRIDAKILIEEFRRQFNEVRPHSSPEQLTPAEFKRTKSTISPAIAIILREIWSDKSRQVRPAETKRLASGLNYSYPVQLIEFGNFDHERAGLMQLRKPGVFTLDRLIATSVDSWG
jgi:hypothetical protein